MTPAFTSSSLYLPIAARIFWSGNAPASDSLLALTSTMNRIVYLRLLIGRTRRPEIDTPRQGCNCPTAEQGLALPFSGSAIDSPSLRTTPVALGGHLKRVDLRRVRDFSATGVLRATSQHKQRLLVRAAERHADDAARRWNDPEVLAVRTDHLDSRVRRDVDASGGVDGAAVAVPATFELRELPLIGQRAVPPHVKGGKRRAVGDIQRLLIATEDDSVRSDVLAVPGDDALRIRVVDATLREVHAAVASGAQIVRVSAEAVQRIAPIRVRQNRTARRELRDGGSEPPVDDERRALRIDRQ